MYYRPLLPNGKKAPLPWQLRLFYVNVNWPLRDDAPNWLLKFDRIYVILGFITFLWVIEAEFMGIWSNRADIIVALGITATCTVSTELTMRIFNKAFFKAAFKEFIKQFYLEIYIDEYSFAISKMFFNAFGYFFRASNPQVYADIQSELKPAVMYTYFYFTTLMSYFSIPILGLLEGEFRLPFVMVFPFRYEDSWPIYMGVLAMGIWAGTLVVASIISESYLLVTLILHLNARFELLQEEIENVSKQLLEQEDTDNLADNYSKMLRSFIKRNTALLKFAAKLESQYTFPIFVMLSLSAVLLCIVAFETLRIGASVDNVRYVCWILAKILELVILGKLGSILSTTTDRTSTTYYCSIWEHIIEKSTNTAANVRAMKLLALTITLNRRPFHLTGANFFYVSLETTLTILRGAASYFTFLCSIK